MSGPFYIELYGADYTRGQLYESLSNLKIDFVSDKLLDLPIRDSKLRFLHFIWRSQSDPWQWGIAHSKPAMRQAVQHAISTGKLGLTCLLIDLGQRGPSLPASAVKPEDFLTAARYNHVHILRFLLEFDSRDFPRTDSHLKQWMRSLEAM